MINLSAFGWINKFLLEKNPSEQKVIYDSTKFHENNRETGFLVGYTTHFVTLKPIDK